MNHDLTYFNDIFVKHNDLSNVTGPTVIALAHNEMYFLPAWLAHYRKLGAVRFIVLDDASTDGTLSYLSAQPDVMVVGSHYRFGDTVPVVSRLDSTGETVEMRRMVHLWRMILPEMYTMNKWVVQAALDEFLVLPDGISLGTVFDSLDGAEFDAVIGTMLDVYPRNIVEMRRQKDEATFDLTEEWFFDAELHRQPGESRHIYPGSRARLQYQFLPTPEMPLQRRLWKKLKILLRSRLGKIRYPSVNATNKYSIVRWRPGTWLASAHQINLKVSKQHLLPILHMKFTGDLYRRAEIAVHDKSYYNGSKQYIDLVHLLEIMEKREGSFLYHNSASIRDVEAFRRSGLLVGF